MATKQGDRLLTQTEAAYIIGVSQPRISQLIGDKKLKAERIKIGKITNIRLRESVVMAYKKSREIPESLPAQAA